MTNIQKLDSLPPPKKKEVVSMMKILGFGTS